MDRYRFSIRLVTFSTEKVSLVIYERHLDSIIRVLLR